MCEYDNGLLLVGLIHSSTVGCVFPIHNRHRTDWASVQILSLLCLCLPDLASHATYLVAAAERIAVQRLHCVTCDSDKTSGLTGRPVAIVFVNKS